MNRTTLRLAVLAGMGALALASSAQALTVVTVTNAAPSFFATNSTDFTSGGLGNFASPYIDDGLRFDNVNTNPFADVFNGSHGVAGNPSLGLLTRFTGYEKWTCASASDPGCVFTDASFLVMQSFNQFAVLDFDWMTLNADGSTSTGIIANVPYQAFTPITFAATGGFITEIYFNVVPNFNNTSFSKTGLNSAVVDNAAAHTTNFVATVPEPSTWALMIIGFGSLGMTLRHRRLRPQLAG